MTGLTLFFKTLDKALVMALFIEALTTKDLKDHFWRISRKETNPKIQGRLLSQWKAQEAKTRVPKLQ